MHTFIQNTELYHYEYLPSEDVLVYQRHLQISLKNVNPHDFAAMFVVVDDVIMMTW